MDGTEGESNLVPTTFRKRLRHLFSANQLYECLQPMFLLTFWHGLTPFYVARDASGNKRLKSSAFGYLNGLVHVVIYSICYTMMLLNNCETVAGYFFRSRISYFGDFLQILSGFIGVTVIYFSAIIPKQRLQRSLQTMHQMDTQLRNIGVKIMYSRVLRFCYFTLGIMFVVNMLYTSGNLALLMVFEVTPSLPLKITFVLQHTVISIAIAMFAGIAKLLETRISMMHKVGA